MRGGKKETSSVEEEVKYFDIFECVSSPVSQTNLPLTCSNVVPQPGMIQEEAWTSISCWYFTGQLRLQLWMMKIGPWWHRAALYRTEVLPRRWHFWYSQKILFRASSSVLSPGKAISPSVWTIITAVFILFLFVLRGLLNITSVCVTQRLRDAVKPAHALAAPRANFAFPSLRN